MIVANKANSLDVDKIDYLRRDTLNIGGQQPVGFDYMNIITNSRIIDNQICYDYKVYKDIYQLFKTRARLFEDVYIHPMKEAFDIMIVEALLSADIEFKFMEMIKDPEAYVDLTDTILTKIEASKNDDLETSKNIIRRIKSMDLYELVAEQIFTRESLKDQVTSCTLLTIQISVEKILQN